MPPIDISRVFRLLDPFLQENSEIREQALILTQIADSNGQSDAEDDELTADEIRHYVADAWSVLPAAAVIESSNETIDRFRIVGIGLS